MFKKKNYNRNYLRVGDILKLDKKYYNYKLCYEPDNKTIDFIDIDLEESKFAGVILYSYNFNPKILKHSVTPFQLDNLISNGFFDKHEPIYMSIRNEDTGEETFILCNDYVIDHEYKKIILL